MIPQCDKLSDKDLAGVSGGMSEEDLAILWGKVTGHLMNALNYANRDGNTSLAGTITDLLEKCRQGEYAYIHSTITALTGRVYDSSSQSAYDSLVQAVQVIDTSDILKA